MSELTALITALTALSVVTERFVELIKGVVPFLNQTFEGTKECWRMTILRLLAVFGGWLTVSLAHTEMGGLVEKLWNQGVLGQIALGLLASGGSGLWNAALKFVGAAKDLRKTEAATGTQTLEATKEVVRLASNTATVMSSQVLEAAKEAARLVANPAGATLANAGQKQ